MERLTSGDGSVVSERTWWELEVGLRVGPLTYEVRPEMVAEYCGAMPVDGAPYRAGGAYDQAIMPPTMLATDYVPLLKNHLSLGWGLMARHTIKSLRPVRAGDTVTVTGEIVDKFERKGRHYWTLAYRVLDAGGEMCLDNRITCSVD